MPGRRTHSRDTSPAAEAAQFAAWREMDPARKLALVSEWMRACEELSRAGVLARHPNASPREVDLRLAALRIDRETMIRFFRWDPRREGY